jgi:hypothetical protein
MPSPKTKPTRASVAAYLAARGDAQQRADCKQLIALMRQVTGKPPRMWGPSIVGFGSSAYTTAGGRTGEMPLAAFAIRGRDLVVYLEPDAPGQKAQRARLGPHSMGKSCLYFRRLTDLDQAVLKDLVLGSMAVVRPPPPAGRPCPPADARGTTGTAPPKSGR